MQFIDRNPSPPDGGDAPEYAVILTQEEIHLVQAALQQYLTLAQGAIQNPQEWQHTLDSYRDQITPSDDVFEAVEANGMNHLIALSVDGQNLLRGLIDMAGDLTARVGDEK